MERLTAKAYNEYDGAARAHMVARLLQESVGVPPGSPPSEHCSAVPMCIFMSWTMYQCMQSCAMVKRHVAARLLQKAVAVPAGSSVLSSHLWWCTHVVKYVSMYASMSSDQTNMF